MTLKTPKAFVAGWPVDHSRSPLIHRFWLKTYGIRGEYKKKAIAPDKFNTAFMKLRDKGYAGGNITIPHKVRVMELVDETDVMARKIGAVNTVQFVDNKIIGTNTDGYGFLTNLQNTIPDWRCRDSHAVVLGAGGAARAVVAILLAKGAGKIILSNRTAEKATELQKRFGERIEVQDWERRSEILGDTDLLVNTTSLGMVGKPKLEIDLAGLNPKAVVADLVYTPLETRLLQMARKGNHPVADGLGMLLHQAAPGFEIWFGKRPEISEDLRKLVMEDLENRT